METSTSSAPSLTAVTFEFRLEGQRHEQAQFLFEPDEGATGAWLNDVDRDFNRHLTTLIADPRLVQLTVTPLWEDGVRVGLVVPDPKGVEKLGMPPLSITCVGDLLAFMTKFMKDFGQLEEGVSEEDNVMLTVAARAGRIT
jgi:hypothetical protein